MATRRRRTLEERIADEQETLEGLKDKLRLKKIQEAVDGGLVSDEDQLEFSQLKKEIASVKKIIKAADRHERPQISNLMNAFLKDLTEAMTGLVSSVDE